ncbi:tyrosine-type recombinase/integrase [Bifidobacterium aerophilum]|uniref:Tyrosine-type recombinase/integrase n=2 Tax=Bifidobacterium aerophilum TaxID=1798155 RepID=A0A6N9Z2Q5_9BIFI|nr:tyrosine-type recombinase/integrase [Bifidobacterium aerophilum]
MNMDMSKLPASWRDPVAGFIEYKRAGGCSEKTLLTRYYQLRHFADTSDTPPEQVTTGQLVEALADGRSQDSRKGLRNCFATFFRWMKAAGLADHDPAATLPNVRKPRPHPKPCPDRYITAALEKATSAERVMILLAAECGLRRAEIAQVHRDDVIGTQGAYSLVVHGKGGKQRIVPLPDDLAETITHCGGWMFPGRWKGHCEESHIGKHISRLLPEGYGPHKLRHRFATVAYQHSHDMLAVSTALGHASTETTQIYVALANESLRGLVDAATIVERKSDRATPSTDAARPMGCAAAANTATTHHHPPRTQRYTPAPRKGSTR